ncbi:MAG: sulfur oxidation c-type cytochrome SoxA [Pseudomonadota bacterium]|nr:sulfur oxidation c-type cytochrome SoxA [Pseudomonadota bacterium]
MKGCSPRFVWQFAVSVACAVLLPSHAVAQDRRIAPSELRSGVEFAGADVRAMQADEFANPGMLWVERGQKLWNETTGAAGKSCASCHGDAAQAMRGVATHYPAYDSASRRMTNLATRISDCRVRHQKAPALQPESEDLLALSAYVAHQSHGMPMAVRVDGPAKSSFERGGAFYYQRHGQMNISCAQCHEQNWGKQLLRETISQGHGTAFPAYRLEWQALGSLQRRLRACLFGVRAEMPPMGAPELLDLELFLAWRAEGLPVETPGVRR